MPYNPLHSFKKEEKDFASPQQQKDVFFVNYIENQIIKITNWLIKFNEEYLKSLFIDLV